MIQDNKYVGDFTLSLNKIITSTIGDVSVEWEIQFNSLIPIKKEV